MKLSLSVRIAERFGDKRKASMSLDALADLAAAEGYNALCMRASQLGVETPSEVVSRRMEELAARGLAVSMVTGDFAIPENSDEAPMALRNITPHLDLAEALGADLIRVGMKREDDIPWAQRAADEAGERGIRLAHQCHTASPFERVGESLRVLGRVDRGNFGITYEPANLELCGEDYGGETIKRLAPHMFNVYLQNQRLGPDGQSVLSTWSQGEVRFDSIPIWQDGGVDLPSIIETLGQVGYDGYVTVHQAAGSDGPEEAIRRSARYLFSLLGRDRAPRLEE